MTQEFDFIVIGGGSGGIAAARRATEYGARVMLIENGRLGGTCVNVGCVPKKVMWNTSAVREMIDISGDYGYQTRIDDFSWNSLKQRRDAYVERLNGIYRQNLDKSQVTTIKGWASFVDARTIEVDQQQYSAPHILVATGGSPTVPGIPGHELGITSDGFSSLNTSPGMFLSSVQDISPQSLLEYYMAWAQQLPCY